LVGESGAVEEEREVFEDWEVVAFGVSHCDRQHLGRFGWGEGDEGLIHSGPPNGWKGSGVEVVFVGCVLFASISPSDHPPEGTSSPPLGGMVIGTDLLEGAALCF
jgi:hypothetical protein